MSTSLDKLHQVLGSDAASSPYDGMFRFAGGYTNKEGTEVPVDYKSVICDLSRLFQHIGRTKKDKPYGIMKTRDLIQFTGDLQSLVDSLAKSIK